MSHLRGPAFASTDKEIYFSWGLSLCSLNAFQGSKPALPSTIKRCGNPKPQGLAPARWRLDLARRWWKGRGRGRGLLRPTEEPLMTEELNGLCIGSWILHPATQQTNRLEEYFQMVDVSVLSVNVWPRQDPESPGLQKSPPSTALITASIISVQRTSSFFLPIIHT